MAAWYKNEKLTLCERKYRTKDRFEREAARATEYGWEITSMVDHKQLAVDELAKQQSAGGGCATALVAGVFNPEPAVTATFSRTARSA